jgi:hypothetical protein
MPLHFCVVSVSVCMCKYRGSNALNRNIVRARLCMPVYVCVCVCIIYIYIYIYSNVDWKLQFPARVFVCLCVSDVYVCAFMCLMRVCFYLRVYVRVCAQIDEHVPWDGISCLRVRIPLYTYVCMRVDTNTHIQTRKQPYVFQLSTVKAVYTHTHKLT